MVGPGAMVDGPGNDAREAKLDELGRAYAAALLGGDEIAAETVIREAMEAGLATAEIDDEIITPALWLVGELWERGDFSVADEHLATEISLRVLALQREARRVASSRAGRRVMLAAPSGEHHVVALRMAANLLRDAGYMVVMLGADVPPDALAASAGQHEPDVICLSATMPGGDDQVLIAIGAVQAQSPGARYVVGGRGLTSRIRRQPGIGVCERVSDVVGAVDALVKRADLN
jgi:methanogenic corrinoid protein MtbC1